MNAYDALLAGDAKPTVKLVALEKPVPELVLSHLARLFVGDDEGNDSSKINVKIKKLGRKRGSGLYSKSDSIALALVKRILIERMKRPLRDVEDFMQEELGTKLTYLRKAIRKGNNLLIDFEKHGHKFYPPSEEELQKKWPDLFNNIS